MNPTDLIATARAARRSALDEQAGKALLAAYGIRVPRSMIAHDSAEAAQAFPLLSAPVVVKVMSPDILHKSDAGGVRVNLISVAEVQDAIEAMADQPAIRAADVKGWLIEEMAPPGQELVIGAVRDPQFGPLLMVGLGGIFVEVLADVAFRICPVTRLDAQEMLAELKGAPLLDGARGRKPASRDAIVDVMLKIGGEGGLIMSHADDIREADVNPLIVSETGAVAADARFILG